MSWFSELVDDPINFIEHKPLKALALLGAPLAAVAAPFAIPEIAAGAGALGLGEAAGAGALGLGEAAGLGALEGGAGLGAGEGLLGGAAGLEGALGGAAGGTTASEGALGGLGLGDALGFAEGGGDSLSAMAGLPDQGMTSSVLGEGFGEGGGITGGGGGSYVEPPNPLNYGPSQSEMDAISGTAGGDSSGLGGELGKAAGGAPESPGFFSKAWSSMTNDPLKALGIGVAGAGLGYNLLAGQKTSPNVAAMQSQAGQMSAQAKQLMSYLQQGTLPPGLDAAAKSAGQAMKARIVANAAKNGMSTDPSQNSALAQELNGVDAKIFEMIATQGVQLLNSGITLSGLSTNLYSMLEQLDRQKAAQTGQAIANFAAALNGGGSGLYRRVGA